MDSAVPPSPDERARLAAWRRLEGLPADLELGIHPADEMRPGVGAPSRARPGQQGLAYLRAGQQAVDVLAQALEACGRSL
ncbi:MAG TPA: hypothetical protein VFD43_07585, partial [Planctomycetota bacterium]|nr:hypothetical protein [Planctomycetota bacterium]